MFRPADPEIVQVRITADLPEECGGAVTALRDGRHWIILGTPAEEFVPVPLPCEDDQQAWKNWGLERIRAGRLVSAADLAEQFALPPPVAVWAFWQYAAEAALLQIAGFAA